MAMYGKKRACSDARNLYDYISHEPITIKRFEDNELCIADSINNSRYNKFEANQTQPDCVRVKCKECGHAEDLNT